MLLIRTSSCFVITLKHTYKNRMFGNMIHAGVIETHPLVSIIATPFFAAMILMGAAAQDNENFLFEL